ncbi:MAG: hypothetical protein U0805_17380 [Pirellulales bacterium]
MLDKNVGHALLNLDLAPSSDPPTAQIERIIDTDRRRVKRWTRISIGLWVLAALGAMLVFVAGALVFPLIAKMVNEENSARAAASVATESDKVQQQPSQAKDVALGSIENPATSFQVLAKFVAMCIVFGTASFMVLVFAGIATVLLLLNSRSATLRQINANLLQISEQLKRLPPSPTSA